MKKIFLTIAVALALCSSGKADELARLQTLAAVQSAKAIVLKAKGDAALKINQQADAAVANLTGDEGRSLQIEQERVRALLELDYKVQAAFAKLDAKVVEAGAK